MISCHHCRRVYPAAKGSHESRLFEQVSLNTSDKDAHLVFFCRPQKDLTTLAEEVRTLILKKAKLANPMATPETDRQLAERLNRVDACLEEYKNGSQGSWFNGCYKLYRNTQHDVSFAKAKLGSVARQLAQTMSKSRSDPEQGMPHFEEEVDLDNLLLRVVKTAFSTAFPGASRAFFLAYQSDDPDAATLLALRCTAEDRTFAEWMYQYLKTRGDYNA